jgi:hypothetical protein
MFQTELRAIQMLKNLVSTDFEVTDFQVGHYHKQTLAQIAREQCYTDHNILNLKLIKNDENSEL